ncbi:DUF982 domain-containing protein [Neorhizobium sp. LjRoot104]|uniref:DUF982 domain-containing protein n=1 Tax=Neorhizobium sp. LjRoot104 TaxID=3342254 RepID=UPI003F4FCB34
MMRSGADNHGKWVEPVTVQIGRRAPEKIQTSAEALLFLTNKWPCERGLEYQTSRDICSAAIRRQIGNDAARASFVVAASVAKLII